MRIMYQEEWMALSDHENSEQPFTVCCKLFYLPLTKAFIVEKKKMWLGKVLEIPQIEDEFIERFYGIFYFILLTNSLIIKYFFSFYYNTDYSME
jgi:hypothetical protein